MSVKTTHLLSSGEFCKLRYDTIPVKSASANVSFYTNNTKMPNFGLWQPCSKWAICIIEFQKPVPQLWHQIMTKDNQATIYRSSSSCVWIWSSDTACGMAVNPSYSVRLVLIWAWLWADPSPGVPRNQLQHSFIGNIRIFFFCLRSFHLFTTHSVE